MINFQKVKLIIFQVMRYYQKVYKINNKNMKMKFSKFNNKHNCKFNYMKKKRQLIKMKYGN